MLKVTFLAVSKAAIDAKLSKLQTIRLQNGEKIVIYSNRILELFGELESAGPKISQLEVKRALLRRLIKHYDVTVEATKGTALYYNVTIASLIVRYNS